MRKEYRKLLKRLFKERLKEVAPEFEEIKVVDPIYLGQSTYQWSACEGTVCFIILIPNPKGDDSYTIEVGWSALGSFPKIEDGSWITIYKLSPDRIEYTLPICICRIGTVYAGKDIWWTIGAQVDISKLSFHDLLNRVPISKEEAFSDVQVSLNQCMPILKEHGIGLLQDFVARTTSKELR